MCYTSGTTGNPKGVVYSHRSIYLHSMYVCMREAASACSQGDRVLRVVPLFHANAWGLPYAAFMTGATLIMPDRFLQAEPLAADDRAPSGRPAPAPSRRSGTTCSRYLDAHPTRRLRLRQVIIGGSACPPALMRAFAGAARRRASSTPGG